MKYLLIDLDRTLWDFDGNAEITFQELFRKYRLSDHCHTDYHTFHEYYRLVNDQLWEQYRNGTTTKETLNLQRFLIPLKHFGVEDARLALELANYYVIEGPKQTRLMPGARHLLDYLSSKNRDYTLCVITNGFSEAQIPKMRSSKIYHYFKYIFLSEDLGYMKPDRRFFDETLRLLCDKERSDIAPTDCFTIGDDFGVDILGSHRVGIPSIFYNQDGRKKGPYPFPPTHEVSSLLEIESLL